MNSVVTPQHDSEDEINFGALIDVVHLQRKLIAIIALSIGLLGMAYAMLATPIYEADLSVQVEDSPGSTSSMLGSAASLFDTKTAASAEIEILRSRMVLSKAVDSLALYISAQPKYLPVLGRWLAGRSAGLSTPILGRVSGNESIEVSVFNVPAELQNKSFTVLADGMGGYTLKLAEANISIRGLVGASAVQHKPAGDIELLVKSLTAKAGATFSVVRGSRLKSIETLQDSLVISEKGKASGVIGLSLQGSSASLTARTLNEIGFEYIRQNVHRKSEEAEKTLAFLATELPEIKRALEAAENKYNRLRDSRGTIDIGAEGKGLLDQTVGIEVKLVELQQKRDEMLVRYTTQHPSVVIIDGQMRTLNNQKLFLQGQIKKLPSLQQDMLSLERDVKVNTELYTSLLNTSQQLDLVKASKIGTARMIDVAVIPEESIKPKRQLIALMAIFAGLFVGVAVAFIRKAMNASIDDPKLIENATGLPVYATILQSKQQQELDKQIKAKLPGNFVLADSHRDDLSVESLRSFRVALQFAMLDAPNNRVMITGPLPGIGKSFISANLAAILAQSGKRVLLLDLDLHKGHLNQYFGLERRYGISELLAGEQTLAKVTHKNVLANLDFVSVGLRVTNPSALLLTNALPRLLDEVSAQYDIVLIDAPPVLLVSDVSVLAPLVANTFLVVRDGVTSAEQVISSQKRLLQAHAEIKGVLFNGQLPRVSSSYAYKKYGNYKQHVES
jgi:tyrosine-protein kinase Etk/Wzc